MEIKKVGVVGCGLMGGGITEVCARSGYDVVTLEVRQEFLDKGIGSIRTSLERGVKKGRLTEQEKDAIAARIKGTLNMEDFRDRDIVIEAAIENMAEKTLANWTPWLQHLGLRYKCPVSVKPPSGTVTFLFTDVQDSTRLWESAPADMAATLQVHDAIVPHAAIERHDGHVFATGTADGFGVAFSTATSTDDRCG